MPDDNEIQHQKRKDYIGKTLFPTLFFLFRYLLIVLHR